MDGNKKDGDLKNEEPDIQKPEQTNRGEDLLEEHGPYGHQETLNDVTL